VVALAQAALGVVQRAGQGMDELSRFELGTGTRIGPVQRDATPIDSIVGVRLVMPNGCRARADRRGCDLYL
jgi:hypothetical protein